MEFSKLQICVDLFLFSAQYTDIATVATLPKFTAGQLFYYPVSIHSSQGGSQMNFALRSGTNGYGGTSLQLVKLEHGCNSTCGIAK